MTDQEKWLVRRWGYVQGRVIGAGFEPGAGQPVGAMPAEARAVVRAALAEFRERWPEPALQEEQP